MTHSCVCAATWSQGGWPRPWDLATLVGSLYTVHWSRVHLTACGVAGGRREWAHAPHGLHLLFPALPAPSPLGIPWVLQSISASPNMHSLSDHIHFCGFKCRLNQRFLTQAPWFLDRLWGSLHYLKLYAALGISVYFLGIHLCITSQWGPSCQQCHSHPCVPA